MRGDQRCSSFVPAFRVAAPFGRRGSAPWEVPFSPGPARPQGLDGIPFTAAGCGSPVTLARLKKGQTVLDLGCGAGFDAFLAAERVGPAGRVIAVDEDAAQLRKARARAGWGGYDAVEFYLASMERLPVPDGSVDVVLGNCALNRAADKPSVLHEIARVLTPTGRLALFDLVLSDGVRAAGRPPSAGWAEWLSVAYARKEYLRAIRDAGFPAIVVWAEAPFPLCDEDALQGHVLGLQIVAGK